MDLEKQIKDIVVETIEKIPFHYFSEVASMYAPILKKLIDAEVIDYNLVDEKLEHLVVSKAQSDLIWAETGGYSYGKFMDDPDVEPSCLAYAIKEGKLPLVDLKRLPFENISAEYFVNKYHNPSLINDMRSTLLGVKPVDFYVGRGH